MYEIYVVGMAFEGVCSVGSFFFRLATQSAVKRVGTNV